MCQVLKKKFQEDLNISVKSNNWEKNIGYYMISKKIHGKS